MNELYTALTVIDVINTHGLEIGRDLAEKLKDYLPYVEYKMHIEYNDANLTYFHRGQSFYIFDGTQYITLTDESLISVIETLVNEGRDI